MATEELTYEKAITELEDIVKGIESGEVNVDLLTERLKRAAELIKFCNERLKGTQDAVSKILVDMEGAAKDGGPPEKNEKAEE